METQLARQRATTYWDRWDDGRSCVLERWRGMAIPHTTGPVAMGAAGGLEPQRQNIYGSLPEKTRIDSRTSGCAE